MSSPKINIPNPCPMSLNRVKSGDSFFCKSCDKPIVDFRDKTAEEIITYFQNRTGCGIFHEDQVTTSTYSFKNKFLYKVLTVLAVFGLNVKPLNAQSKKEFLNGPSAVEMKTVHHDNSIEKKVENAEEKEVIETEPVFKPHKRKRHRRWFRRRHVMGARF
jgi:hypothetical protein